MGKLGDFIENTAEKAAQEAIQKSALVGGIQAGRSNSWSLVTPSADRLTCIADDGNVYKLTYTGNIFNGYPCLGLRVDDSTYYVSGKQDPFFQTDGGAQGLVLQLDPISQTTIQVRKFGDATSAEGFPGAYSLIQTPQVNQACLSQQTTSTPPPLLASLLKFTPSGKHIVKVNLYGVYALDPDFGHPMRIFDFQLPDSGIDCNVPSLWDSQNHFCFTDPNNIFLQSAGSSSYVSGIEVCAAVVENFTLVKESSNSWIIEFDQITIYHQTIGDFITIDQPDQPDFSPPSSITFSFSSDSNQPLPPCNPYAIDYPCVICCAQNLGCVNSHWDTSTTVNFEKADDVTQLFNSIQQKIPIKQVNAVPRIAEDPETLEAKIEIVGSFKARVSSYSFVQTTGSTTTEHLTTKCQLRPCFATFNTAVYAGTFTTSNRYTETIAWNDVSSIPLSYDDLNPTSPETYVFLSPCNTCTWCSGFAFGCLGFFRSGTWTTTKTNDCSNCLPDISGTIDPPPCLDCHAIPARPYTYFTGGAQSCSPSYCKDWTNHTLNAPDNAQCQANYPYLTGSPVQSLPTAKCGTAMNTSTYLGFIWECDFNFCQAGNYIQQYGGGLNTSLSGPNCTCMCGTYGSANTDCPPPPTLTPPRQCNFANTTMDAPYIKNSNLIFGMFTYDLATNSGVFVNSEKKATQTAEFTDFSATKNNTYEAYDLSSCTPSVPPPIVSGTCKSTGSFGVRTQSTVTQYINNITEAVKLNSAWRSRDGNLTASVGNVQTTDSFTFYQDDLWLYAPDMVKVQDIAPYNNGAQPLVYSDQYVIMDNPTEWSTLNPVLYKAIDSVTFHVMGRLNTNQLQITTWVYDPVSASYTQTGNDTDDQAAIGLNSQYQDFLFV